MNDTPVWFHCNENCLYPYMLNCLLFNVYIILTYVAVGTYTVSHNGPGEYLW